MFFRKPNTVKRPLPGIWEQFGIRSLQQLGADMGVVLEGLSQGNQFQLNLSSLEFLRPDLSFPAYGGWMPKNGMAPIYHLFDRTAGGQHFSQRVTRNKARDFRGKRLSYDEHDGTDIVCPPGLPLVAAAPGTAVMIRPRFLRGGLTIALDHGHGILTQYTHCSRAQCELGQTVQRGETIALAGTAGLDMTAFFPWIPPHIHFMAWWNGRPLDPFLALNEPERPGLWLHGNAPLTSLPLENDPQPELSPILQDKLEYLIEACLDEQIRLEFKALKQPAYLAALLEDALHHDLAAWPQACHQLSIRPNPTPESTHLATQIKLTLPLPVEDYHGTYFANTLLG